MPKSIYKTIRLTPELAEWLEKTRDGRSLSGRVFHLLHASMTCVLPDGTEISDYVPDRPMSIYQIINLLSDPSYQNNVR